jgi:hypothetical protein
MNRPQLFAQAYSPWLDAIILSRHQNGAVVFVVTENLSLLFIVIHNRMHTMKIKILPCSLYQSLPSVQALQSRPWLSYSSYATAELSDLNGRNLTTAKFTTLIFSMSGFALSYAANIFLTNRLQLSCSLIEQLFHLRKNSVTVDPQVSLHKLITGSHLEQFLLSSHAENLFS